VTIGFVNVSACSRSAVRKKEEPIDRYFSLVLVNVELSKR